MTPTAASYANRPARLLTITEQRKNAKYAELAEREHASFSTLALNAFGVFGKEFIAHLDRIVDFAKHHNTYRALSPHPSHLKRRFKTEILATLMKGNARYRMQAMQQCLTKSTPNYITNSNRTNTTYTSLYLSQFSTFFSPPSRSGSSQVGREKGYNRRDTHRQSHKGTGKPTNNTTKTTHHHH